jgi:hypothetical protein
MDPQLERGYPRPVQPTARLTAGQTEAPRLKERGEKFKKEAPTPPVHREATATLTTESHRHPQEIPRSSMTKAELVLNRSVLKPLQLL